MPKKKKSTTLLISAPVQEAEQSPATVDMNLNIIMTSERQDGSNRRLIVRDEHGNTWNIPADAVSTSDDAGPPKEGDTRLLHIARDAAIAAGMIEPSQEAHGKTKPLPQALAGRDVHWYGNDILTKTFPLSDADKLLLGEEMAAAQARIDDLENELAEIRKSYKAKIDLERETLSSAAERFNSGETAPQNVKCDVFQDFTSDELVWVSADENAEILNRRPMTPEERQPTLFEAAPCMESAPFVDTPQ